MNKNIIGWKNGIIPSLTEYTLLRYNSIFSSPLVQNPPTPISFFSLGSLLDWSRRRVPGKRVQGLLWHGNWGRRMDASLELYICRLQQFRESLERNHTKTKLGSGPERECSHLDNSSVEWNRLQLHKLSLWRQLGRQVLIKSNINNWLICLPGTESLVDWLEGNVSCQIVKYVTDTCKDKLAPGKFSPSQGYGPMFYTSTYFGSTYYYFEGYTLQHWPTHDPCGQNSAKQEKNVVNPHGNIFIRNAVN